MITLYILIGLLAWCWAVAYESFWFKVLTFIPFVFLWLPLLALYIGYEKVEMYLKVK